MNLVIEIEIEEGSLLWIADVVTLPGVMCYGASREEAVQNAKDLAAAVWLERGQDATTLEFTERDLTLAADAAKV